MSLNNRKIKMIVLIILNLSFILANVHNDNMYMLILTLMLILSLLAIAVLIKHKIIDKFRN